jgi:hypothetical protein
MESDAASLTTSGGVSLILEHLQTTWASLHGALTTSVPSWNPWDSNLMSRAVRLLCTVFASKACAFHTLALWRACRVLKEVLLLPAV